jgi:hypothetical protein
MIDPPYFVDLYLYNELAVNDPIIQMQVQHRDHFPGFDFF